MSKNKKGKVETEVELGDSVDDGIKGPPLEELLPESDNSKELFTVSIIPKIKNNKHVYEIVKFTLKESGSIKDKEVIHTTINEHTAMTLLFQTAHETFTVKELRKKVKELKGGN
jgi:hypothetical protein